MDKGGGSNNQKIGAWGEDLAGAFLKRHGFEIVERNYHCPVGELDIVAKKNKDLYFVEVKTRRTCELANDWAITKTKKERLGKTIKHYCYHRKIEEKGMLSAGLLVTVDKANKKVNLRLALFL